MKERRGTVGRLTGLAEGVAASARRRQRGRAPRVLVYDAEGHPQAVPAEGPSFERIVLAAERMIALAAEGAATGEGPAAPSSSTGVSVREPRLRREPE